MKRRTYGIVAGLLAVLLANCAIGQELSAAQPFGVTQADGLLTVSSGAGLVFKVRQANGDIMSIRFHNGPELQGRTKPSQVNSGFPFTVSEKVAGSVAVITLTKAGMVHTMLVRAGENTIYMGTSITEEPPPGELRWITRLDGAIFTSVPAQSNLRGNTGNIESKDIFGMADGTSRSKYYGNDRALDYGVRGVTGNHVGVFMAYGNRETSSGGPFFRDIQHQSGVDTELYNYMNSGHNQTEARRMGFNGPYALMFTDGATPAAPDMGWIGDYHLDGWVGDTGRGRVAGQGLAGRYPAYKYTVGFANGTAQYWTAAAPRDGSFSLSGMKAGTYTMTVYKGELDVHHEEVTVSAGQATLLASRTITGDPASASALWRIGRWDGTPLEFLNGAALSQRHPGDVRNAAWAAAPFAVGSVDALFPAVLFRAANTPQTVTFNLTAAQVASHTLRIGITAAYAGGRPAIAVNGWTPAQAPSASTQPHSRSVTIGTYRGNNTTYTYAVPASALVAGQNTLSISIISGSGESGGSRFLSPAVAIDAIDML
jgi:rhamnogalacturonan endolyase